MTDIDLNKIKAGDYVLVAHRWDEITSKPGQPFDFVRHRKGDKVTLDVEQARRLVVAGAVVKPGAAEEQAEVPGSGPSVAPSETGDGPGEKPATVEDILAEVGEDKAKAAAALEAEKASRGEKARKTLVEPLEAILAKE